ncbi:hypothetical protein Fcan01_12168 [Folsomia candida]|uniref:Uncharacterized protein n=1 Tax=Folsomia candida TaxID=158441 RepID=A0A226E5I4_FOLCA|nr:hypothetical protein Fcan01_12168 [Folsomia candida]
MRLLITQRNVLLVFDSIIGWVDAPGGEQQREKEWTQSCSITAIDTTHKLVGTWWIGLGFFLLLLPLVARYNRDSRFRQLRWTGLRFGSPSTHHFYHIVAKLNHHGIKSWCGVKVGSLLLASSVGLPPRRFSVVVLVAFVPSAAAAAALTTTFSLVPHPPTSSRDPSTRPAACTNSFILLVAFVHGFGAIFLRSIYFSPTASPRAYRPLLRKITVPPVHTLFLSIRGGGPHS